MDRMIDSLASDDLLFAMQSNMIAFYASYGRGPDCRLELSPEVAWFVTGIDSPLFNGVLAANLASEAVNAVVATLHAALSVHGVPAFWWLGPQAQPTHLGALLEPHGIRPVGEVPGMVVDLAELDAAPAIPSGFQIERINGAAQQEQWARVAGIATGFADTAVEAVARVETSLHDPHYQAQPRYLGLLDGTPVATSALVMDAGVAGIYGVATIPAARGQGIGRLMTLFPLLDARQQGYRVGVLQASDMGHPVYHKLGFRDVCRYQLYLQH